MQFFLGVVWRDTGLHMMVEEGDRLGILSSYLVEKGASETSSIQDAEMGIWLDPLSEEDVVKVSRST